MRTGRAELLIPWAVALTVRVVMALSVRAPTVLGDEAEYFLAARHPPGHPGLLSTAYPPLYPALLSSVAGIGDKATGYAGARLLGAAVSSTIVPLTRPLWAPAGLLGGCLVAMLPAGIITSGLLLSENLFAPLLAVWLLGAAWWMRRPSAGNAAVLGLAASAAALTRAAGGAVVLAALAMMLPRRCSIRQAAVVLLALAPVALFVAVRHGTPPRRFNDPLAVEHPQEITRALSVNLDDLTRGTALEPLAERLRWPPLFAVVWGSYWCLQYALYIILGTGGIVLVFLSRHGRCGGSARNVLLPLAVVTGASIALSANHTVAGVQADQFVRGRYLEPLLPLWFAAGLGALASGARFRLPLLVLPAFCLAALLPLSASQNRATAFLYPIRSVLLSAHPLARAALSVAAGVALFWVARVLLGRPASRRTLIGAFVGVSLVASCLRFYRQHSVADELAVPARWLAIHDPHGTIEIVTASQTPDSLKASGLWWAVQQIRFFSANPLTVAPDNDADYSLRAGEIGVVCTHGPARHSSICLVPREVLP